MSRLDQNQIPMMGLGTFGRTGKEGLEAILSGVEIGYRHLDTAQSYDTEQVVGEAVRRCGLSRDSLFITTKVAYDNLFPDRFIPSLEASRDTLQVERIDLTLVHWPRREEDLPFSRYMEALAQARDRGLTSLIGVSNFTISHLRLAWEILGPDAIVNNQIEVHPFLQNRKVAALCADAGILVTAYVPLAKGKVSTDPVLAEIAQRHGALPSQIALAWLLHRGIAVIPASSKRENMKSNFDAAAIKLSDEDVAEIDALDRGERIIVPTGERAMVWD
jgi:2,5-diketo-D-gluconate reductase B